MTLRESPQDQLIRKLRELALMRRRKDDLVSAFASTIRLLFGRLDTAEAEAELFRWLAEGKNGQRVKCWGETWEALDIPDLHPLNGDTGLTLGDAIRAVREAK